MTILNHRSIDQTLLDSASNVRKPDQTVEQSASNYPQTTERFEPPGGGQNHFVKPNFSDHLPEVIGGYSLVQPTIRGMLHLLHHTVEVEGCRFLPRREIDKRLDLLCRQRLSRVDGRYMVEHPVPIGVGTLIGPFEGVAAKIEKFGHSQFHKRFRPDHHALGSLFQKDDLPVADADSGHLAVIIPIEEPIARAFIRFPQ